MGERSVGIVWFRRDLRLDDNPAWADATSSCDRVAAAFVWDPVPWGAAGPMRRKLLVAHLGALHARLGEAGGGLWLLPSGDDGPAGALARLARELGASKVHANAEVSPQGRRRETEVSLAVDPATDGGGLLLHWGNVVHRPGSVTASSTGRVHRVFTPFYRAWKDTERAPWPDPGDAEVMAPPEAPRWPDTGAADDDGGLEPGEEGAAARLERWLEDVDGYKDRRDSPADDSGTSRLSSDLHFGTIAARHVADVVGEATPGRAAFVRQLAWRDWYAHLVHDEPSLTTHAMNPDMDRVAWRDDPDGLEAWKQGRTGYPIVDAAMRELAATGWMHNRVRMITASFLTKDLLVDWRLGEAHFRELLVDYDLSQNVGNWQWVAGTGPDASPYFRVFNPVTQGRTHDPDGDYVRQWVPELRGVKGPDVHAPWELGPLELAAADVDLGEDYPERIVDHAAARERAISTYSEARGAGDEAGTGDTDG